MRLKIIIGAFILAVILSLSTFLLVPRYSKSIWIKSAATAKGVDDKLKPVGVTREFVPGTSTVYCWFEWSNSEPNTSIIASWYFVTDDIHILDYSFDIPRKSGSGSVSLTMPAGKELPGGQYRVDLKKGKNTLTSLTFKILEKD